MSVSIITAGYSTKYIEDTWKSIKKQTYEDWEWILVIDGSLEMVEWFSKKSEAGEFINYNVWTIMIEKNQGRFGLVSRNVGAMAASNDKILFLDDDNSFEENDYVETVLKTYSETKKIPYTKLHLIGKKEGSEYDRRKPTNLARQHIDLGNILYRKEFFERYGYFSDRKNRIMFDWDMLEVIINGVGIDNFVPIDKYLIFLHKRY
jgi:glycosyltransferase involved in cell wall biosynthesis